MLIKFCGLTRQADVDAALALGADFCGFIFHPASPRHISPAAAAALHSGPLQRVGVFVEQDAPAIVRIMAEARLDMAQLHGGQNRQCAAAIGAERVIRVFWPCRYPDRYSLEADLRQWSGFCALCLLDAGYAGGGSGQRLDWQALAHLEAPCPWLLAGGLDGEQARSALMACTPDGLDFNSGVETAPGRKNHHKMAAAVAASHNHTRQTR